MSISCTSCTALEKEVLKYLSCKDTTLITSGAQLRSSPREEWVTILLNMGVDGLTWDWLKIFMSLTKGHNWLFRSVMSAWDYKILIQY